MRPCSVCNQTPDISMGETPNLTIETVTLCEGCIEDFSVKLVHYYQYEQIIPSREYYGNSVTYRELH